MRAASMPDLLGSIAFAEETEPYADYVLGAGEVYVKTFKPSQNITRAEAIKITNAVLGRIPDRSYINSSEDICKFSDLSKLHWAYYEIIEATIAHDYLISGNDETWTSRD